MAIPDVDATYPGQAPTKTGQVIVSGGTSVLDYAFLGTGVATLDGSLTVFNLNFIDGTELLGFVPTRVLMFKTGGTAAEYPISAAVTDAAQAVVTINGAGSNAETIEFTFLVAR